MAETIEVGKLTVPVVADLAPFERAAKQDLKQRAEAAGKEAAKAVGKGMASGAKGATKQAAEDTVKEFIKSVKRAADVQAGDAKEALLRKLIDRKEFEKRGREAVEAMNKAILDEIRRRATAGTLKTADFADLTKPLKVVGERGGKELGEEVKKGAKHALGDLNRWLAGGFVVAALATFAGLATRIVRMFQRVASGIKETLEVGGSARVIRDSYEGVAGSRGADPTAMLNDLRAAARGTTTDLELMRRATFALNAGLPATGQQMGELANIARRLGAAVGRDATDSFQRLAEGIAKGRAQTLQDLGIMTKRSDALKEWERQTGRNASALSEQQKVMVHLAAVLEEGRGKVKAMGDEADEAVTPVHQLGTFLANLRDRAAESAANAPAVVGMLTQIGNAAAGSADKVQGLANHVGAYVATVAELTQKYGGQGFGIMRAISAPVRWMGGRMFGGGQDGGPADVYRKNLRLAEIQSETDLAKLAERRRQVYTQIDALEERGVQLGDERLDQLWDEYELIRKREAALKPKPALDTADGPTGPTEDELKAADTALKSLTASMREFQLASAMGVESLRDAPKEVQAALRELLAVQQQIEAAEKAIQEIRAGGKTVPAGAEAYLQNLRETRDVLRRVAEGEIKEWQKALPEIAIAMQNSFGRIPQMLVPLNGQMRTLSSAMAEVADQAKAAADAERELTHAQLERDPERTAAAEKALAAARKAMAEHTAQVAKALKAAGVPTKELNALLERLQKLLADAGVKAEALPSNLEKAAGAIGQIASAARGVMSVADAMGALDERTRSAMQATVDLADGLAKVVGSGGKDIGGIVQTVGAAIKLFSGSADKAERMRQTEEMVRLREALVNLRDAVLSNVTAQERERMVTGGQQIIDFGRGYRGVMPGGFGTTRTATWQNLSADRQLDLLAQQMGMSKDEVLAFIKEIEKTTGAPIWDSKNGVNLDALAQALDKMPDLGIGAKDLMGQLDNLDWLFRTIGEDALTAGERLDRFLGVLQKGGASAFADEFQRILDEQGAEAAQAWLDSLAYGLVNNAGPLLGKGGIFEGLTGEEARRIIERSGGFVSGSGGGIVGSPSTRMSVNQTVTQGDEMIRIQSTQLYHQAEIHRLLAAMVGAPAPSYGAHLPDITPPSPASLGLGGGSQVIQIGDITVQQHFAPPPGGLTAADLVDAGRAAGDAFGEAAGDRIRSAYRGSGSSGPTRVRVQ